eukprot:7387483-Prymnesium_polylepis.1
MRSVRTPSSMDRDREPVAVLSRGWIELSTGLSTGGGSIQSRGAWINRQKRSTDVIHPPPGSLQSEHRVRGWLIRCVLDRYGRDDPPGGSIQWPSGSISGGWVDPRPVDRIYPHPASRHASKSTRTASDPGGADASRDETRRDGSRSAALQSGMER